MSHTATRRWTLPLSALLLVNTALVASAFWHVSSDANQRESLAAVPPVAEALAEPVEPIVEVPAAEIVVSESTDRTTVTDGSMPLSHSDSSTAISENARPADETFAVASTPELWGDEQSSLPLPVVIGDLPPTPASDIFQDTVPTTTPIVVLVEDLTPAPSVEQPTNDPTSLVIINPPTTGGVVHFVVDDQTFSLAPGELQRLTAGEKNRVRFHRGDEFGNADERCPAGVFAFVVAENGWSLGEIGGPAAARLLEICLPAAALRPANEN